MGLEVCYLYIGAGVGLVCIYLFIYIFIYLYISSTLVDLETFSYLSVCLFLGVVVLWTIFVACWFRLSFVDSPEFMGYAVF